MFTTKQESLDQKASKIRTAVYNELRPAPQPMMSEGGYIRDVYEDHVIYCEGEHDWKVPFTTDAEGDLEVAPRDEWTEVEQTWTEVKSLRDFIVRLKAKGKRGAKAPLGQGGRFAALEAKIAARGKVSNPAAVAAAIGRNKYGAGRMAKLSAQGRKHKEMSTTFKFNRAHDALGRFAKKVGGAAKRAAGGIARRTAASYEKKYGSTARAIGKIARHVGPGGKLLGKVATHVGPLGEYKVRKKIGHAIGTIAKRAATAGAKFAKGGGLAGAATRHVGPGGKLLGKIALHVGPAASYKVRKRILGRIAKTGRAGKFMAGGGLVGAALRRRRRRKEFQMPMTSFVFKGADDSYRWVLLSSNGFRDKDGEIVSTKALRQDVAQWELAGSPAQPLRFWHIPLTEDYSRGLEIGTCDFRMVSGHTLIESGTFLTKEIGEAVFGAQDKLAASLGFRHSPFEPDGDKIFNTIRTFERSLLPKESASNSLTYLAAYAPQGA